MKVVEQKVEIMSCSGQPVDGNAILKHLETVGRTCYRSHDKIKEGSAEKFVNGIVKSGHGSIIEHASISVRFITSRDVTHQIVRHRIFSQAQESQRYVNYVKDKFGSEIVYIRPPYFPEDSDAYGLWEESCRKAEETYFNLVNLTECTAEEARAVLPNSTKTELITTGNLREWRHFFEVRCDVHAQLPIRLLALDLLSQLHELIPCVFDDQYMKFIECPDLNSGQAKISTEVFDELTKVVMTVEGEKFAGFARCNPADMYQFKLGNKLALARMCIDFLDPYVMLKMRADLMDGELVITVGAEDE